MIHELIENFLKLDTELAEEVKKVLKELKDKQIEEEQAKIDLEKKKNKNTKGWVEPVLDTDKISPRIPDNLLYKIFQWRLSQNDCRYRGYIIDGFPRNYENNVGLFAKDAEKFFLEESQKEPMAKKQPNKSEKASIKVNLEDNSQEIHRKFDLFEEYIPQTVIFLQGNDEFLKERCKGLGTNVVGTHYTEEGILRRLLNWRRMNEENIRNIIYFYRDNEFEILDINVEEKKSNEEFFSEIVKFIERVEIQIKIYIYIYIYNRKDHSKHMLLKNPSWRMRNLKR